MKILFLFLLFSGTVCAQQIRTATDYNDYIVDLQTRIGQAMILFNDHVSSETATMSSSKPYFEEMLKTTRESIKFLEKLEPWEKNSEMKDAAMNLFRFYEMTIDKDYRRMMEIIFHPDGFSEENIGELTQILERVTVSEAEIDKQFQQAQTRFAKKYGFSLEENSIQKEFEK